MTKSWSENRWDNYGLTEAEAIARMSKDPSTQCGAAIIRPDKTVAAKGFNGFPRGIPDTPELYFDRDEKYRRVIHCEMNAILTAREPLHGYTLYTWPFLTCERCAVHVIQSGVARVVAPEVADDLRARWGESFRLAKALYEEAGVDVEFTRAISERERKSTSVLLDARWHITDLVTISAQNVREVVTFAHDDLDVVRSWYAHHVDDYQEPQIVDTLTMSIVSP